MYNPAHFAELQINIHIFEIRDSKNWKVDRIFLQRCEAHVTIAPFEYC